MYCINSRVSTSRRFGQRSLTSLESWQGCWVPRVRANGMTPLQTQHCRCLQTLGGEGCGGISLPQSTARILKASFGTWPSPDSRTFFGIPWLPSWSIPSKSWSKEQGKQLHLRRLSRLVDEPQLQEHRRKMCKTAMQRWSRGGYELPMKMEAEPTETTKDDQQVSTGRGLTMPIMHIYIYYTRTHIIWWYIYIYEWYYTEIDSGYIMFTMSYYPEDTKVHWDPICFQRLVSPTDGVWRLWITWFLATIFQHRSWQF